MFWRKCGVGIAPVFGWGSAPPPRGGHQSVWQSEFRCEATADMQAPMQLGMRPAAPEIVPDCRLASLPIRHPTLNVCLLAIHPLHCNLGDYHSEGCRRLGGRGDRRRISVRRLHPPRALHGTLVLQGERSPCWDYRSCPVRCVPFICSLRLARTWQRPTARAAAWRRRPASCRGAPTCTAAASGTSATASSSTPQYEVWS